MSGKSQTIMGELWHQKSWVFLLLIVAGIGLGAVKASSYRAAAEFSQNGVAVIGEITHMNDYSSANRSKTFDVSYTFATAADPFNHGNQRVSERFYDTLADGEEVDVWYLPNDPSVNVVDIEKLTAGFGLTIMLAMGLILTGIVGGGFAIRNAYLKTRSN